MTTSCKGARVQMPLLMWHAVLPSVPALLWCWLEHRLYCSKLAALLKLLGKSLSSLSTNAALQMLQTSLQHCAAFEAGTKLSSDIAQKWHGGSKTMMLPEKPMLLRTPTPLLPQSECPASSLASANKNCN